MGSPEARTIVHEWIEQERDEYAIEKWESTGTGERLLKDAIENPKMLPAVTSEGEVVLVDTFVMNYLTRIRVFGLDTLPGRQAMGKLIVTLTDHLERAVDVHGPMPKPGVPSGTIEEWDDPGATYD